MEASYKEFRFVVKTDMEDHDAERFATEIKTELQDHLIPGEELVSALATDKISYESKQAMKHQGVI